MAATICCIQHRQKESKEKKWKSVLKINEQCHIWKNKGKLKKQDQCKTCKQEKKDYLKWTPKLSYLILNA